MFVSGVAWRHGVGKKLGLKINTREKFYYCSVRTAENKLAKSPRKSKKSCCFFFPMKVTMSILNANEYNVRVCVFIQF